MFLESIHNHLTNAMFYKPQMICNPYLSKVIHNISKKMFLKNHVLDAVHTFYIVFPDVC